jgi:phosphopantothenate-cysteine ligase
MTIVNRTQSLERIHTSAPKLESAIDRTVPESGPAEVDEETNYFATNPEPPYLAEIQEQVHEFIAFHSGKRRIALVTSGGTTVPLENNTVRFIDNFSAGTRGATSTEYFIENGYAVIFLHRQFSLLPYSRHYSHNTNCFLDYLDENEAGTVVISKEYQEEMKVVLNKYQKAKDDNLMLFVPFTTVNQYLFTLRLISLELKPVHSTCLFFLAAAVSDFFLPTSKVAEHKIQSQGGGGKLVVDLDPVPKFLKRLVEEWAPNAMIVSFKLETDEKLLLFKARQALTRYSHQLVIGNLLQTRKREVVFVTTDDAIDYTISEEEEARGVEIESVIIPKVIDAHTTWISQHKQ